MSSSINKIRESALKNNSTEACKCIDKIDAREKSPKEISKEVKTCIDKHVTSYQLVMKIAGIMPTDLNEMDVKKNSQDSSKKNNVITISTNNESDDYKNYYYELERYLMDNCKSLKSIVLVNDAVSENSFSRSREASKYYEKGVKEMEKEKYEKAIEFYKKAVDADSVFAFAWDNLGICYRKLNMLDDALIAYNKSLSINPNGLMPLQNIAVVYEHKKQYSNAVIAYEKLAIIDPENPESFYGLGYLYVTYLSDYEKGLNNLCDAYTLYIKHNSPYRTDAEKMIQKVYTKMKEERNEKLFLEILKKHKINSGN